MPVITLSQRVVVNLTPEQAKELNMNGAPRLTLQPGPQNVPAFIAEHRYVKNYIVAPKKAERRKADPNPGKLLPRELAQQTQASQNPNAPPVTGAQFSPDPTALAEQQKREQAERDAPRREAQEAEREAQEKAEREAEEAAKNKDELKKPDDMENNDLRSELENAGVEFASNTSRAKLIELVTELRTKPAE